VAAFPMPSIGRCDLTAEVARRESLRRTRWIKHCIAGPLENATVALEDLQRFAANNQQVAHALVPDEKTASLRSNMSGLALTAYSFEARLKAVGHTLHEFKALAQRASKNIWTNSTPRRCLVSIAVEFG
jgi:hypothetical protein